MPSYGPMSDAQVAERLQRSIPYWNDFSTDAFLAADPELRTLFADAYIEAEGDPIALYGTLNDKMYQGALRQALQPRFQDATGIDPDVFNRQAAVLQQYAAGHPESEYAQQQIASMNQRSNAALEQFDEFGNAALENMFAASVPSAARNVGLVDYLSQRFGGRTYPGMGAGLPAPSGPAYQGIGPQAQGGFQRVLANLRTRQAARGFSDRYGGGRRPRKR